MEDVGIQTDPPVVATSPIKDDLLCFPLAMMRIPGACLEDPSYHVVGADGGGPAAWRVRRMMIAGHLLSLSFTRAAHEWLERAYRFARCATFAFALGRNEQELRERLRRGSPPPPPNNATHMLAEVYAALVAAALVVAAERVIYR